MNETNLLSLIRLWLNTNYQITTKHAMLHGHFAKNFATEQGLTQNMSWPVAQTGTTRPPAPACVSQPHADNRRPIPHPRSFLFSGHNISICCQPPPVSSCRLLTGPHARRIDRTAGPGVSVSSVIDRELCRLPCLLRQTGPSGGRRNVGRRWLAISVSSQCRYMGRIYLGLRRLNINKYITKLYII
jgi:hypothetical protein